MTYEVLQVTPCNGIRAMFRQEGGSIVTKPVVALVTRGDCIRGVVITHYRDGRPLECSELGCCEEIGNFAGYLAPGEEPPS